MQLATVGVFVALVVSVRTLKLLLFFFINLEPRVE